LIPSVLAIVTSHPIQYQAPLWRALAAANVKFEVWFLTPHAVQPSPDREFGHTFAWDLNLLEGYPHRFLPVAPDWRLDRFNGVRLEKDWNTLLRERGVTHLWIEGWRFLELWRAVSAAHRRGVEVWLRGETNDLSARHGLRELGRRMALHWLYKRVQHFLCIGSANRRFYRSFGVADARLHSAPYSVDNSRFRLEAEQHRTRRQELRTRWGIPGNAFVFLFCGKLIAKKRPLDLVAAARLASGDCPQPLHLLFAGDGALAGAVKTELLSAGVPGNVTGFLNQSEITSAYAAADCLVLPSDAGETWGLVVNEALASGLDVVVSDRCGSAEDLAAPLGAAHVYRCGDITGLAKSMVTVASHPSSALMIQSLIESHAIDRTVASILILTTDDPTLNRPFH
jgi:glycosyltransferase involved in cell wall biosynthesis